ncbi:hypothetical protein BJ742DRAFT_812108 [Cladochytrium replicatum]|nr:hypothetical protein BJ742DRAFT_812108 [Cladochytrium replicatum]
MSEEAPLLRHSSSAHVPFHRRRWIVTGLIAGVAATAVVAIAISTILAPPPPASLADASTGITREAFDHGLRVCNAFKSAGQEFIPKVRTRNPRFTVEPESKRPKPVLLRNALLIDGDGTLYENVDIFLSEGLIVDVGPNLTPKGYYDVVDVEGRYVTPGLVDQHSHMGVGTWPAFEASEDGNEMTDPLTPMVRSLDGIHVDDKGIKIINAGGVTTSLVLPGSGNMMGGEAYVLKHLVPTSNLAEDMLINYGMNTTEGKQWRWMKMACGENPKRYYGGYLGRTPLTRMGEGWLFRSRFQDAQKFKQAQDDWCYRAETAERLYGTAAHSHFTERLPEDYLHESLAAVLRHDIKLNIHCYEPEDIELIIRTSHEFNFRIGTFHHALEAWQVAPTLAKENISVAIFATNWAYKKEAYDASVHDSKILTDAGVTVAFKSDHPVMNAQNLILDAGRAHHFGLPAHHAIRAVTMNPADRLGLGWRIGRVKPGYDADVVVWNRYPLENGAHPLKVYVDGYNTYSTDFTAKASPRVTPKASMEVVPGTTATDTQACTRSAINSFVDHESFTITNIGKLVADESTEITNAEIVVSKGHVKCFGAQGKCKASGLVYDLGGGYVVPGAVSGPSKLGLSEISAESSTQDGDAAVSDIGGLRAVDGISVGNSKILNGTFNAGVTAAFAVPSTEGLVQGVSTLIRVGAKKYTDAVITEFSAVHAGIGQRFKSGGALGSISGQVAALRSILLDAASGKKEKNVFSQVVHGEIPLVLEVHSSEDILKVLRLKEQVEKVLGHNATIPVTIAGASEAWYVADELAAAGVSVSLIPLRCVPDSWEKRKCRVSGTRPTAVEILQKAGVQVSLGVPESEWQSRELFWEAGFARADMDDSLSEKDAIGLVTWNVVKALGGKGAVETGVGRIVEGKRASFVVLNGSPLEFGSEIQLVVDGKDAICLPQQL